MRLVIIRHGATKSNSEHRYIGATDEDLSAEGRNKLYELKEKSIYSMPEILFVSPMIRCRQTAEILFPGSPYKCIHEFKEFDFGIFEGKNHDELDGDIYYQQWINSGCEVPIKCGESKKEFIERTLRGFEVMTREICEVCESKKSSSNGAAVVSDNNNITVIVHGGTIMALLSSFFDGSFYDYHVDCGEGYECLMDLNFGCTETVDSIRFSGLRKIC